MIYIHIPIYIHMYPIFLVPFFMFSMSIFFPLTPQMRGVWTWASSWRRSKPSDEPTQWPSRRHLSWWFNGDINGFHADFHWDSLGFHGDYWGLKNHTLGLHQMYLLVICYYSGHGPFTEKCFTELKHGHCPVRYVGYYERVDSDRHWSMLDTIDTIWSLCWYILVSVDVRWYDFDMENDLQLSDIFTIDMQRLDFIEKTTWHKKKVAISPTKMTTVPWVWVGKHFFPLNISYSQGQTVCWGACRFGKLFDIIDTTYIYTYTPHIYIW